MSGYTGTAASQRPLFQDKYETIRLLGKGAYGGVHLARDKVTGKKFAAKVLLKKTSWTPEVFQKRVMQEVAALQMVRHENIIELVDYLRDESATQFWVVMQLATGGDVMQRIIARHKANEKYTEAEVSSIIRDVLSALAHLHARHIVHCDIKPENILYRTSAHDSPVCLVDFGLAQLCERGLYLSKFRGTPDYIAPELFGDAKKYNAKADVWSVGCLLAVLLSGRFPFRRKWDTCSASTETKRIKSLVLKGYEGLPWKEHPWPSIDEQAKDLIRQMLTVDPDQRPTAVQCLEHRWLRGGAQRRDIGREVLQSMEHVIEFNRSRGAMAGHSLGSIVTQSLTPESLAKACVVESDPARLALLEREGGLQQLLSLGYHDNPSQQESAVKTLADLAQKSHHQRAIVEEGGVRLLCHLALSPSSSNNIRFFTAMAFKALAANASLRIQVATDHMRHDTSKAAQVVPALVQLGACGDKRTVVNAASAVGRLGREPSLHAMIRDAGALPLLLYVASPSLNSQPAFRTEAGSAVQHMLHVASRDPDPDALPATARALRAAALPLPLLRHNLEEEEADCPLLPGLATLRAAIACANRNGGSDSRGTTCREGLRAVMATLDEEVAAELEKRGEHDVIPADWGESEVDCARHDASEHVDGEERREEDGGPARKRSRTEGQEAAQEQEFEDTEFVAAMGSGAEGVQNLFLPCVESLPSSRLPSLPPSLGSFASLPNSLSSPKLPKGDEHALGI